MYLCVRFKKFILLACTVLVLAGFAVKLTTDGLKYESAVAEASGEIFVPVIMYHGLLKDPDRAGDYIVSPDTFKADMKYLQDNGFTTVFVKDLVNYAENGADLPDKPVVVTFDDGYYNIMEYAYPFMRENGLKGVINVVGAYTEKSTDEDDHNPAYSYLTWEEIAELDGSGVFEIGNHTFDMHSMTGRKGCKRLYSENAEDYRRALIEDTGVFQDILAEKSGVRPVTFAYPYGFISEESTEILGEIGFEALLTCYEKPNYISRENSEECLILNRYNRPSGISTEAFMEKIGAVVSSADGSK